MIVGPGQRCQIVLPYRISGCGISGLIPVSQIRGIFYTVSLSKENQARLQVYNSLNRAYHFGPKACVAAVLHSRDVQILFGEEAKCEHVEKMEFMDVDSLCRRYPQVFNSESPVDEEKTRALIVRASELQWRVPMNQIPRSNSGVRYNSGELSDQEIGDHMTALETKGVVRKLRPGEPAFYSPVMFLKKKSGKIRTVQDLRLLNAYLEPWRCAFPGTLETLRRIPATHQWMSVLDLADGFWLLPLDTELEPLFAMDVQGVAYTWRKLPQGFCASPGLFHSRIASIFSDMKNVVVYMDDVLITSETVSDHRSHLDEVMRRLDAYGLKSNPEKAQLCKQTVLYLGFEVTPGKLSLRHYAEKESLHLPPIRCKRDIRKLVGIMNQCRSCCPRLDVVVQPLLSALKMKKMPLEEDLQRQARNAWEQILGTTLRVHLSEPGEKLFLQCDWSQEGQGYALYGGDPGQGKLLAVNSRCHDERHLSSYLGELRTIVWALCETKSFTARRKLKIFTDSNASVSRLTSTPSSRDLMDSRVARAWAWILENFLLPGRLEIAFLPGMSNETADLLSRWGPKVDDPTMALTVNETELSQADILEEHARSGHFGAMKTVDLLRRRGLQCSLKEANAAIRRCRPCAQFRLRRAPLPLGAIQTPRVAGEILHVDVVGPLKSVQGFRYIMTIIDHLTRMPATYPLKKTTSKAMIKCLEKWIAQRGLPKLLVCDGASYWTSRDFSMWLESKAIDRLITPPHCHQSNGMVERLHRTLIGRLRRMGAECGENWHQLLPKAIKVIAKAPNDTTGEIPDEAWRRPELWAMMTQRTEERRRKANQTRRSQDRTYSEGQLVWLWDAVRMERLDDKFSSFWKGPFVLKRRVSRSVWELDDVARLLATRGRRQRKIFIHSDFLQEYV